MSNYKVMNRLLMKTDLRDWATIFFTFIFPIALLLIFDISFDPGDPELRITDQLTANVITFGSAFVGFYAGATHLALWRENGMFDVLRNLPLKSGTILSSQLSVGIVFLFAQTIVLFIIGLILGMTPAGTAIIALIPIILGYALFFFLGVIVAIIIPSMAGVSTVSTILIIPLGFIGGAVMPLEYMPQWVQTIAIYTPLYHMREATSMFLIDLGTWKDTIIGFIYLLIISGLFAAIASRIMRFK